MVGIAGTSVGFGRGLPMTLVTSGLFMVMHLQYDFYAMSTIFVLALILSFARYKSGRCGYPADSHSKQRRQCDVC